MADLHIDPERDMLGIIDVQPTFMPGGELPVAHGDEVVPVINRLLAGPFARAFATQDWHPPDHASFASRHPGRAPFEAVDLAYGRQTLWPDHAVQGTRGAMLSPTLDVHRIGLFIRKGMRPEIDSYSAFFENDRSTPTGLAGALRELEIRRLFFVGLALDYCVAWSAEDAVRLGFEAFVITDASRAIGDAEAAIARLRASGVGITTSASLIPA